MKDPTKEVYEVCPICGGVGYMFNEEGESEDCWMCDGNGEVEVDDPRYKDWLDDHYGF